MRFYQSQDVRKVLLAFAPPARYVRVGPQLALQHILQCRYGHRVSQYGPCAAACHKLLVPRICLQLNAQIRSAGAQIDTAGKGLHTERFRQLRAQDLDAIARHDHIQIETDDRLRVGIYGQTANYAVARFEPRQGIEDLLKRVLFAIGHGSEKVSAGHRGPPEIKRSQPDCTGKDSIASEFPVAVAKAIRGVPGSSPIADGSIRTFVFDCASDPRYHEPREGFLLGERPVLRMSDNPIARHPEGRPLDADLGLWAVAHVKSRQEKAFADDLARWGISYYIPLVEKRTRRRDNNKIRKSIKPLFPGYLAFALEQPAWEKLYSTRRVANLLPVADQKQFLAELVQVQTALESDARVELAPTFQPGEPVRVRSGPMMGLQGEVVRFRGETIFIVRVQMFQQAVKVELDERYLESV